MHVSPALFLHNLHKGNVSSSAPAFLSSGPGSWAGLRERTCVGITLGIRVYQLLGSCICGFRVQDVSVRTTVKVAFVKF